jgi:hypothetical protein
LGQVRCGSRNAGPARSHMRVSRFFPWFPIPASLRDAAVRGAATRGSPSPPGALPIHRTATHGYDRSSLRDNTGSACQNESPKKYTKNTPHPHPSSLIPHPSSLIPHPSSLTLHPSFQPAPAIPEGCQSIAGGRSPAQTSGSRSTLPCIPEGCQRQDPHWDSTLRIPKCRPSQFPHEDQRLFPWFPILASLRDAAVRGVATRGSPSPPGALPDHRPLTGRQPHSSTAPHGPQRPKNRTPEGCQKRLARSRPPLHFPDARCAFSHRSQPQSKNPG